MIRPFTCIAFVLACASGLYVYQAKHRVHVLDDQITKAVKSTEAMREQTRMLHAEWTLLNDPARLQQLADQFLTLKTVSPTQFTSLAQLDSRLPAPVATPAPDVQPPAPVAAESQIANAAPVGPKPAEAAPAAATKETPVAAAPIHIAEAKLADPPASERRASAAQPALHPPPRPRAAMADPRPIDARPVDARPVEQRPIEPRTYIRPMGETRMVDFRPALRPIAPIPAPQSVAGGSLLGMAHGSPAQPAPMPMPRPMPVNSSQYNYGAAGG